MVGNTVMVMENIIKNGGNSSNLSLRMILIYQKTPIQIVSEFFFGIYNIKSTTVKLSRHHKISRLGINKNPLLFCRLQVKETLEILC